MLGEKHDLVHELPEFKDKIHELKANDPNFAKLFDQYNEVELEVRRIEEGFETPADDYIEERKKLRLSLKDQLFALLKDA